MAMRPVRIAHEVDKGAGHGPDKKVTALLDQLPKTDGAKELPRSCSYHSVSDSQRAELQILTLM